MDPDARTSRGIALSPTGAAGGMAAFLLAALVASAGPTTSPGPDALLDGARDKVVLGAFVPYRVMPQGEVRLVRRGGAVVMQTVLHTSFLARAVAEIRRKELASWPPDRAGHDDALKYMNAVLEARERIQAHPGGGGRQAMLIEFILSDTASFVAISEPEVERVDGHMRVAAMRPITVLELSRTYVRGNIYEIARDALGLGEKESEELLEPLLPPESGGHAASSGGKGRKGADR